MFRATIGEREFSFDAAPTLFSPGGLDGGTAALLRRVALRSGDKVLDLGCGYGAMGVYAATITDPRLVWLTDVDPLAVEYARRNLTLNRVEGATALVSDGLRDLRETGFNVILCNPPYHADFSVPKHLIEKGFNRLAVGGALWMVTKRDAWYRNKLTSIFGRVRVHREADYFVFAATKIQATYATRLTS